MTDARIPQTIDLMPSVRKPSADQIHTAVRQVATMPEPKPLGPGEGKSVLGQSTEPSSANDQPRAKDLS